VFHKRLRLDFCIKILMPNIVKCFKTNDIFRKKKHPNILGKFKKKVGFALGDCCFKSKKVVCSQFQR